MKRMILAGLAIMIACSSGCTTHLPPHAELTRAVKQSFDASGFNYRSQSRITHLSLPKLDAEAAPKDKKLQAGLAAFNLVRGFSVATKGAVDQKGQRAEVLYDLHYNKDNVELSLRLPLLIDYRTQTIYIGPSFIHTLLSVVAPQETNGKELLLQINIPELLRQEAATSPSLAKMADEKLLGALNMDIFSAAMKDAINTSLQRIDPARFSDQPLTADDRAAGVDRSIRVELGQDDAIATVSTLITSMAQALRQQGVISEEEQTLLLTLTDKEVLSSLTKEIDLGMTQDVGVSSAGLVRSLRSQIRVADRAGNIAIGLESTNLFDRYGAPTFTIQPEASHLLDIREMLDSLKSLAPAKNGEPAAAPQAPDAEGDACCPDEDVVGA